MLRYTGHMQMRGNRRTSIAVVTGIIIVVLAVGLAVLLRPASTSNAPTTQPKNVVRYSTDTPSEQPATSVTYHSTATGTEPQYIKLPTISVEGYIQAVGLDQHGAVVAPSNIHLAGWYINTLTPGQNGLSIIDGHVDGKTARGIFYTLGTLKAGDAFEVDLANGQVKHFIVKNIAQVPMQSAAAKLFARDNTITSQLNLITCGGSFNRTAGVYDDRIIVVAALAP